MDKQHTHPARNCAASWPCLPRSLMARLADAVDLPHLISCFTSFHDKGVCSGGTSKPRTICSVQSSRYSAAAREVCCDAAGIKKSQKWLDLQVIYFLTPLYNVTCRPCMWWVVPLGHCCCFCQLQQGCSSLTRSCSCIRVRPARLSAERLPD